MISSCVQTACLRCNTQLPKHTRMNVTGRRFDSGEWCERHACCGRDDDAMHVVVVVVVMMMRIRYGLNGIVIRDKDHAEVDVNAHTLCVRSRTTL